MKLSPRDASAYFRSPDPKRPGLLIHGDDAMRVAARRQEVLSALLGPNAEEEMRLTRLPANELRKDTAALIDAVKAQGFFPGARAVHVESATDGLSQALSAALEDWQEGDAQIVVTAGLLTARSSLRKLFEGHRTAYAAAIYNDPPGRDEVERMIADAGLKDVPRDATDALLALSRDLPPGDFRQTVEKLALFKVGDSTPVTADEVALIAPRSSEAALDDALEIVASGRTSELGPVLRRLYAQGVNPVTLCIGAVRHFRQLHAAASDPGGASAGVAKLRPPVFGPRRDKLMRQAQHWGMHRLETGLTILTDTDLQLRSASSAPAHAVMERALIRLAMLARR
ncbi:DNA polymerase III subunit delta [Pelagovum pacificum]|uniref:DNA-directed DNA polymerase n=1 Tax=Pelagovum pacificum TaxID=2588711 RepID=A0A5C5GIQ8_9RHOB|nr:DNA polymerase III subunit delta [Pelagovum pacificum]QQA43077.1 DNA polymerase III subunit delta [Pelagovum pacificum]TNY33779.1 DNA polymerase III subunit delta [Pelagovum pacificum]